MVLQLHRNDWRKLEEQDQFIDAVRQAQVRPGNYMFPCCQSAAERKSEAFTRKWQDGPSSVISVFGKPNMGRQLVLTFIYFLVVTFCLGLLASFTLGIGAPFLDVFGFVAIAGLLAFLAAIVQHAIWFGCRIVGHIIESIAYAMITGAIFAALWPGA